LNGAGENLPGIGKYLARVAPGPMATRRSVFPAFGPSLFLAAVLLMSAPLGPVPSGRHPSSLSIRPVDATSAPEFVNLTDTASNWTSDFYSIPWPSGPFSAIHLEMTLTNFGDPWDRADWVALDNVTLMDVTTLENSSGNNVVQSYLVNVTEYESLFASRGHVWWQAMPNWISPCSTSIPGCWSAVLSFQFVPGAAPPGLPEVVPVFPFATLTSTAPAIHGTLKASGSFARAQAVLYQEGQGTDEFWYVQSFVARELLWQWNNQTVLAMLPVPFINSGGALGGINDLAEWNGTPAPGTGARPAALADLTPWVGLVNQTPWYNFTVVDNANSWQIGLCLLLWNATDVRQVADAGSSVNRTLGIRVASVAGQAHTHVAEPFASERYDLNWSQYLNTSGTTIDESTWLMATDRVVSSTLSFERISVVRTVFDLRVDSSGAVHILDLANWTNTTQVSGNGQNATLGQQMAVAWTIDGASGGLSSVQHRNATGSFVGAYSAPTGSFGGTSAWFANRTSKNGVGSSDAPVDRQSGGPLVPMPGRFVVSPASASLVRGPVRVELLGSPECVGAATVTLGPEVLNVSGNETGTLNDPSLPNGTYALNVSSLTPGGVSQLSVPLRITGWVPPFVAPLTATASVAAPAGEAPWRASFNGSALGGTAPYGWRWTFGDGGYLDNATGANVTHLYSSVGFFSAVLNVTDSEGRAASSEVGVQVLAAISVAWSSTAARWSVGVPLTLTAVASGGLDPLTYTWGTMPPGCHVTTNATLSCDPVNEGAVSISLGVTDPLGYSNSSWFNTTVAPMSSVQGSATGALVWTGGAVAVAVLVAATVVWVYYRKRR